MKKISIFTPILSLGLFLTGCLPAPTPEQQVQQAVNKKIEEVNTNSQEFIQENQGKAPTEVLDTRHADLLENFGEKDIFAYGANGSVGYPIAFYLANQLDLDYLKLAYVQYQSGTMGLQALLEAMDQNAAGVSASLELIQKYHNMTESTYYQENMPGGLTDQEQAAFIVQTMYDVLGVLYPEDPSLTSTQIELVDQLSQLSGLPKNQLSVLADQWKIYSAFEIMPDSLNYKAEAQRLIDEVY